MEEKSGCIDGRTVVQSNNVCANVQMGDLPQTLNFYVQRESEDDKDFPHLVHGPNWPREMGAHRYEVPTRAVHSGRAAESIIGGRGRGGVTQHGDLLIRGLRTMKSMMGGRRDQIY